MTCDASADPVDRDPSEQPPPYNWTERGDHQASLAGISDVVVPGNETLSI